MRNHNHHDALLTKHRMLEAKIAAELGRPLPDSIELQRLKRQKLLVKDEIESWERVLHVVQAEAPRRTLPEDRSGEEMRPAMAVG